MRNIQRVQTIKVLSPKPKIIKTFARSYTMNMNPLSKKGIEQELIEKNKITEESHQHETTDHNHSCHSDKKKCSHCFQDTTRRLTLFLLQDDRIIDRNNPLLCETPHKAPVPLFDKKPRKSKFVPNTSNPINKVGNMNEMYKRSHDEKKEHIININKELIKELNSEIRTFSKKKKPITTPKPNRSDGFNGFIIRNIEPMTSKNNIEVIERIRLLSPYLATKKANNLKEIPFIFRQMKLNKKKEPKGNIINYERQKINLEDILIMHNSTIRKSVSQFKVKDFQLKKSLKLKNRPLYPAYSRKANDEALTSSVNGIIYI